MDTRYKVMQRSQALFSFEAFWFLLNNAHLWIEYPKDILFRLTYSRDSALFTANMRNAVIAQTYISRKRYRRMALEKFEELKSPEGFERIITEFPVSEDAYYYYHFLDWVCFLFYLSMFCFKHGYNYIEIGNRCLATYPNVAFFHSAGGWAGFENISITISHVVSIMTTACLVQRSEDSKFIRFDKSIKKFERRHRYESNKWTKINDGCLKAKYVMQEASAKFRVVSELDSQKVTTGYKFVKCPCKEAASQESEEGTSSQHTTVKENEATSSDINMGFVKTADQAPPNASSQNAEECTGLVKGNKCAFFISERYLRKNPSRKYRPDCKRGIKLCSYTEECDIFVKNLQEVFDTYIKRKNYRRVDQNVLVVCSPDCDYERNNTNIIVLDTSTEEEDEDSDFSDPEIPFNLDFYNPENTGIDGTHSAENAKSCSTEIPADTLPDLPFVSTSPDLPCVPNSPDRPASPDISLVPTHSDMLFVPTRSTGAIPKFKSSVKEKSKRLSAKSTECSLLEDLKSGLEKFNPSTFQTETESVLSQGEEYREEEFTEELMDRFVAVIQNVLADLKEDSPANDSNENKGDD